jgi:hypothetical protein
VQLSVSEPQSCVGRYLAFEATPFYDFFRFEAPVDSRLPGGGGYVIRGLSDSSTFGALPNLGTVTTIQDALEYTWDGVDTHVAYRGPGGWRVSGGSSTGRVRRDTCRAELDAPNAKGREGNLYGGGCAIDLPYRTNIRGSASYTIPWVDVLVGAVFQRRPGVPRSAILTGVSSEDVVWEPSSAGRATVSCNPGFPGPGCFFGGGVPSTTVPGGVDLLDAGDLSGESISLWDLNLQKQIRFGGRRVRAGVQIYNLLNSDAATGYDDSYTAFRLADGTWVEDNPNTAGIVEENGWGSVTQIVAPRFLRFSVEFDF